MITQHKTQEKKITQRSSSRHDVDIFSLLLTSLKKKTHLETQQRLLSALKEGEKKRKKRIVLSLCSTVGIFQRRDQITTAQVARTMTMRGEYPGNLGWVTVVLDDQPVQLRLPSVHCPLEVVIGYDGVASECAWLFKLSVVVKSAVKRVPSLT